MSDFASMLKGAAPNKDAGAGRNAAANASNLPATDSKDKKGMNNAEKAMKKLEEEAARLMGPSNSNCKLLSSLTDLSYF